MMVKNYFYYWREEINSHAIFGELQLPSCYRVTADWDKRPDSKPQTEMYPLSPITFKIPSLTVLKLKIVFIAPP